MTLTTLIILKFSMTTIHHFQINQFSNFQIKYGKLRYVGSVYSD